MALVSDRARLQPSLRRRFGIEMVLPVPDLAARAHLLRQLLEGVTWDPSDADDNDNGDGETGEHSGETENRTVASGQRGGDQRSEGTVTAEALEVARWRRRVHRLAQRTSGYVRRDLERVVRMARGLSWVREARQQHAAATACEPPDLSALSLSDDHGASLSPSTTSRDRTTTTAEAGLRWADLEQALRVVKPGQMQLFNGELAPVRWSEVGGYDDVRRTLLEVVEWPLRHREAFVRLGLQAGSGLLLYGPSGCGKSLLVRALAGSISLTFVAVRGYVEQLVSWGDGTIHGDMRERCCGSQSMDWPLRYGAVCVQTTAALQVGG